jgi:tRNA modification GTPase
MEASRGLETAEKLLSPPEVVIAGPPNAGKSSLANELVGREVSIVTDQPGTTRDWVREKALLNGMAVWLTDTAGLWSAPDEIDAEAVTRSRSRIEDADLIVLLGAFQRPDWIPPDRCLRAASRADIDRPEGEFDAICSVRTGEGMDGLRDAILDAVGLRVFDPSVASAFTQRQAHLLKQASRALSDGRAEQASEFLKSLLEG